MTSSSTCAHEPVRLLFEMSRDDNPRLYDDLIRFNKGTKRVNRLRFLAHEGLLMQHWAASQDAAGLSVSASAIGEPKPRHSAARHTNQAFDAPHDADA